MILNRVKLNDFISHKNTELDLGYGINVVVGPNGAGKTSILDAISFALFNDYEGRGRKENLINARASKCRAAVEFSEGGIKYAVEWSMERKKSPKGNLYRMQNGERTLLAQGGGDAVVPEVEKILGMDKSMFVQSIYVRQGEIEELVTAQPRNRKELISKLLGVEGLQTAWEKIKAVIDEYDRLSDRLEVELAQKSVIETEKQEHIATSKELVKSMESKKKELHEAEKRINDLQALLDQLKESKKTFDKLDKEKGVFEKDIENEKEKLAKEKTELDKAVKAEEKIESLEVEVGKLPFLEDYVAGLSLKREQEILRDGLTEKLTTLDRLEKALRENEKNHELHLEKEKLLKVKNSERKKLEGASDALERVSKQVQQLEKEEQKKTREMEKEVAKWIRALDEQVTIENFESLLENRRKEFQGRSDELAMKLDEYKKQVGALASKKQELDDNLSKLGLSKDEVTSCPTCETELTPDRVAQLLEKFREEGVSAETELKKLAEDLEKIDENKEQVDDKLRKADSLDVDKIRGLDGELKEARSKLAEQKLEVKQLEKQAEELKKLDEDLAKIEAEKSGLEENYQEFESAKRELTKIPSRAKINAEMAPINVALENASQELRGIVSSLGYKPKEPEEELQSLRLKKQEYDQNVLAANRRSEHEANVAGIKQGLLEKEQKLVGIVEAIKELAYDEALHSQKQSEFDTEKSRKGDLKVEIAGLVAEKKATDAGVEDCDKKLLVLKEKDKEKQIIDDFIRLLNKIRTAYGKDGVQKMIRARARPLLERSTRDLFERFNLAYSDIKIDDDYNIAVIGSAGEQDIDQISGGERVALAIALRLAIAQVLSGRVETIIMDEPTTHLDEERRRELVNILNSFFREGGRIIPQMLIITHHREIEDVADIIYTIRKEEGYSIAETGATS